VIDSYVGAWNTPANPVRLYLETAQIVAVEISCDFLRLISKHFRDIGGPLALFGGLRRPRDEFSRRRVVLIVREAGVEVKLDQPVFIERDGLGCR
jgi:hypothetical protein